MTEEQVKFIQNIKSAKEIVKSSSIDPVIADYLISQLARIHQNAVERAVGVKSS